MKRIAVFCGSSAGSDPVYSEYAVTLGTELARRGTELVYGGARVGLMGTIADAVLQAGGKATGVLPRFLGSREIAHDGLTELLLVDSMHERKLTMHDLSDGFIAMPGGFGTLEELFEILTWAQLGLHGKPVGLLNVAGFYNDMLQLIGNMTANGFLKTTHRDMLLVESTVPRLLDRMSEYKAPPVPKWISEEKT